MSAEQLADIVSEALQIVLIVYIAIGIVLSGSAAWRCRRYGYSREDIAMFIGNVFIWLPIVVGEVRELLSQRRMRRELFRKYRNEKGGAK